MANIKKFDARKKIDKFLTLPFGSITKCLDRILKNQRLKVAHKSKEKPKKLLGNPRDKMGKHEIACVFAIGGNKSDQKID